MKSRSTKPLPRFPILARLRDLAGFLDWPVMVMALWLACGGTQPAWAADALTNTGSAGTVAAWTNPGPAVVVNPAATSNKVDVLDDKYRLVIGDQLSYRVLEDEEDPIVLPVTDSGEIQVPYLGRYPAVGKTCKELALAIKGELEQKFYYQATVIIGVNAKPKSRGKIYLVGAVRTPGPQDIDSDEIMTVSRAILRAGGFTDFANQKKVTVTRTTGSEPDDKKTFTVDVSRVFEKGDTQDDRTLLPGDLIYVPERMIRF